MRILTGLVIVLAGLWFAWWWIAATAAERGAGAILANLRAQGLEAEAREISVAGFPNRVDLTLDAPRLATPDGWGWEADFVQLFALTYRPWHLIAAFAPVQRFATPIAPAVLAFDKGQASLVLKPGPDLVFDRFVLDLANPALSVEGEGETRAARALVAARRVEGAPARYDLSLDIAEPAADPRLVAALAAHTASGRFPHHLGLLRLDLAVDLSAPLDRHAAARPPRPVALELRAADIAWGDIALGAAGRVNAAPDGTLTGEIRLGVRNWRLALGVAQAAGWVGEPAARNTERILRLFARPDDPESLDIPLVLAEGQMSLGAIRLGAAPRLDDFWP